MIDAVAAADEDIDDDDVDDVEDNEEAVKANEGAEADFDVKDEVDTVDRDNDDDGLDEAGLYGRAGIEFPVCKAVDVGLSHCLLQSLHMSRETSGSLSELLAETAALATAWPLAFPLLCSSGSATTKLIWLITLCFFGFGPGLLRSS